MITTTLCYSATSGSSVADYGKPNRVDMGNVGSDHEIASSYDAEETTPHDDIPPIDHEEIAHFDLSPTENDTTHPNLSPTENDTTHPNLSPAGGETQRGGSPSAVNRHPIASLHQTRRRPPHNDHNTFKVVRF